MLVDRRFLIACLPLLSSLTACAANGGITRDGGPSGSDAERPDGGASWDSGWREESSIDAAAGRPDAGPSHPDAALGAPDDAAIAATDVGTDSGTGGMIDAGPAAPPITSDFNGCFHPFHLEMTPTIYTSRMGWRWGRCHHGLDMDGPTRVHALFSGQAKTYHLPGYGRIVEVSRGPWRVRYAHVTAPIAAVRAGGRVTGGQGIAFTAPHGTHDAGTGTGQHLHLEVFHNEERVDPGRFLRDTGLSSSALLGSGCQDKTLPAGFAATFCREG